MTGSVTKTLRLAAVPLFVAVGVAACADNAAEQTELGGTSSPGDVGAEVYANSCASCHGADLRGTEEGPSQLSIIYEPNHHTDESYRSAIANGVRQHHWSFGDMPPVEGLTEEEVEAVIGFIRSEQERQGFER